MAPQTQQPPRSYRDEVGAQIDKLGHQGGIGGRVAANPHVLARSPNFGDHLAHHVCHCFWARIPHALAKVVGRHQKNINPGNGQNFVEVFHRLNVFDHGKDHGLRIDPAFRLVERRRHPIVMGPGYAHTAVSVGIVFRGAGHRLGFLAGVHVGSNYPLDTTVQEAQHGGLGVVRNPGYGSDAEDLSGPDHVLHLVQVRRTVLAVDHDEVVADEPQNLDKVRGIPVDYTAEYYLPFGQLGFGKVCLHSLPTLRVWSYRSCSWELPIRVLPVPLPVGPVLGTLGDIAFLVRGNTRNHTSDSLHPGR